MEFLCAAALAWRHVQPRSQPMPNPPDPARQRIKLHPSRHPLELIGLFILLLLVALGIGIRLLLLGGVGPV